MLATVKKVKDALREAKVMRAFDSRSHDWSGTHRVVEKLRKQLFEMFPPITPELVKKVQKDAPVDLEELLESRTMNYVEEILGVSSQAVSVRKTGTQSTILPKPLFGRAMRVS